MNLIISEGMNSDLDLTNDGHLFLGAADTPNGEVHVFLKAGESLAPLPVNSKPTVVEYVKIRIVSLIPGVEFPYGFLPPENTKFIQDFLGEEFQAIRTGINYYQLKNGMLVHVYNAVEIWRSKDDPN